MRAPKRTAGGPAVRLEALLTRIWWQPRPSLLARALQPLSWLYGALALLLRKKPRGRVAVPTLVVGNIVAGGAGKTPTVIALVEAFRLAGRHPGVISRGHGRGDDGVQAVGADSLVAAVGDEPLLIARRTRVPLFVGRDRSAAARALCAAHAYVDVLIADDGLQHRALARDAELLVFDDRGIGNGLLLPAGPLREYPPAALGAQQRVLYTGSRASTALPGAQARRSLARAWPLPAWRHGDATAAVALSSLHGQRLLAVAGLATPEHFFVMLEVQGLRIERLPLPDHHDYARLPWPPSTRQVLTTEKDAVKLAGLDIGATHVWVLPLDFALPDGLAQALLALLPVGQARPWRGPGPELPSPNPDS